MASLGTMQTRLSLILASHMTTANITTLINRVHQEEVEAYDWYRLKVTTALAVKAPKSAGTVAITQDTAVVTGTGTAFAAGDVGSFVRIGTEPTAIEILSFASATSITLKSNWVGTTQTAATYSLFPLYYSLPADAQEVMTIKRLRDVIEKTTYELDQIDPSRETTGAEAVYWAPFDHDTTANAPRIELWPVASAAQLYTMQYKKGHTDLVASTDRPLMQAAVVEAKSLYDAALTIYARSGDQRWFQLAKGFKEDYARELEEAKMQDVGKFGAIHQIHDSIGQVVPYDYYVSHDA